MRMMDFEGRTGAVAYVHQQIGATLSHLDSKAYTYSGLSTAALVYLVGRDGIRLVVQAIDDISLLADFSFLDGLQAGLASLAAILFVLTFVFCMRCLTPRSGGGTESVIYFRGIAARPDATAYAAEIRDLDEDALSERLSQDTYYLAKIARTKLRYSGLAARLIFPGAAALVLAELVRLAAEVKAMG